MIDLLFFDRNVFVTSDSVSVYEELPEFEPEGFNFIFSKADRAFLHHDWLLEMRLRMALVDRKQVDIIFCCPDSRLPKKSMVVLS